MIICEAISKSFEVVTDALMPVTNKALWDGRKVYFIANWLFCGLTYIAAIYALVKGIIPLLGALLAGFAAHVTKVYLYSAKEKEEVDRIQKAAEDIGKAGETLGNVGEQYQNILETEQEQLDQLQEQLETLKTENEKLEETVKEYSDANETLTGEVDRIKREITRIKNAANSLKEALNINEQIETVEELFSQIKSLFEKQNTLLEKASRETDTLRESLAEDSRKHEERMEILRRLANET